MKLVSSLLLAFSLFACSSASFDTPPTTDDAGGAGGDSVATDSGGGGSEVGTPDAIVDPCAPEMAIAKFCVDVKLERPEHPSYDAASGASSLGIDGKGTVFVYLFDKNPALDPGAAAPPPAPKAVLQYPPADHVGEEADIDKDLPLTLSGRAAAGTYWVITVFADNKTTMRGPGEKSVLPGDFVIVPGIHPMTRKAEYPKLTLTTGSTGRVELKLKPYRRVDVDMGVSFDLKNKAVINPTIHGDGPVIFLVYDGDINIMNPNVLSVGAWPCMAVHPSMTPPVRTTASFGTTVDGEHNLLAVLFDYKVDLMGPANLWVQTAASGANPIPKVNISATSWVSSAHADFIDVYFPYDASATVADPLKCP